jgi:hypothetical protein
MFLLLAQSEIAQEAAAMAVKANQYSPSTIMGIVGSVVVALMGILTANFLGMRSIMKNSDKRVDTQTQEYILSRREEVGAYQIREERHYTMMTDSFRVQEKSAISNGELAKAIISLKDVQERVCDKLDNVQCLAYAPKPNVHVDVMNIENKKA